MFGGKITPSERLVGSILPPYRVWRKGQRSAFDFVNRGYRGAWLLADGSMVTDEVSAGHLDFYEKYRAELAKAQGIRMQSPADLQIYFSPVTDDQKQELARFFREWEKLKKNSWEYIIFWDFTPPEKRERRGWYDTCNDKSESGEGRGFGDFLRALEKYERSFSKRGSTQQAARR